MNFFHDILRRDNDNADDLLLSILWILYAKRPLTPGEYYHALWSGLALKDLADPEIPSVAASDFSDCAYSYVITSSKGLAEVTVANQPTVQFIHEAVRDFLIKDGGLHDLWTDLGFEWDSPSHDTLKNCCNHYLNQVDNVIRHKTPKPGRALKQYPFLEYASKNVLYHADMATNAVPQGEFLTLLSLSSWIRLANLFEQFDFTKYRHDTSLLYVLADRGHEKLIRTKVQEDPCIEIKGGSLRYPLFAAIAGSHREAVLALLGLSSSNPIGVEITADFEWGFNFRDHEGRTPLSWALQKVSRTKLLKILLSRGSSVHQPDESGDLPLETALQNGNYEAALALIACGAVAEDIRPELLFDAVEKGAVAPTRLLRSKGGNIGIRNTNGLTLLELASRSGQEAIVKLLFEFQTTITPKALDLALECSRFAVAGLLIEKGANIHARDPSGMTPLSKILTAARKDISWNHNGIDMAKLLIEVRAHINDHDGSLFLRRVCVAAQTAHSSEAVSTYRTTAALLIQKGAKINIDTVAYRTPLHLALERSSPSSDDLAMLLIKMGADVKAKIYSGLTPLHLASRNNAKAIANLLIEKGADLDDGDYVGNTALHLASSEGHGDVVRLLLEKGAEVNTLGADKRTALHLAAAKGHEDLVRLLLENGTDTEARDVYRKTALQLASDNGYEGLVRLFSEKRAT